MNVVLVGYRGPGKSAVGKKLAEQLGLHLVSLDAEIERTAEQPIPDFVAENGWAKFRDLEETIVQDVASGSGQVIDCGGGVIEREANFEPLQNAGPVVWLRASVETIVERIGGDDQRPSLTGTKSFTEEVSEVLERRTPLYERIATHCIDTDQRDISSIVGEIVSLSS